MDKMTCIKDYLVRDFPNDYTIPKGEVLEVQGYLMGMHLTLKPDPAKYPSPYKHLDCRHFTVFENADKHFKELAKTTTRPPSPKETK